MDENRGVTIIPKDAPEHIGTKKEAGRNVEREEK